MEGYGNDNPGANARMQSNARKRTDSRPLFPYFTLHTITQKFMSGSQIC